MANSRLLCARVEALQAFTSSHREYWIKQPKLCSVFLSECLVNDIQRTRELVSQHGLAEAAVAVGYVTWHYSAYETVIQHVNSSLHVRSSGFYFCGALHPENDPSFKSLNISFSDLNDETKSLKKVDHVLLESVDARRLTQEIESLDKEVQSISDRRDSLEDLRSALERVPPPPISVDESSNYVNQLSLDIAATENALNLTEERIVRKCLALCKAVLGIEPGDSFYLQPNKNQRQALILEHVRFWDGTMFLDGPRVLKNGAKGKRTETAMLTLFNQDERK